MHASNAPDSLSTANRFPHFPLQKWEKRAADGHPALNAPDLSGIPAQTDSASKANLKKNVFSQ